MMTKRVAFTVAFTLVAAGCGGTDGVGPEPPPGVISLNVGQSRTVSPSNPTNLEVSGGASGAEFVLVPVSGSASPTASTSFEFTATNVTAVVGPPNPQIGVASGPLLSQSAGGRLKEDAAFHSRIRRFERDLAPRMATVRQARTHGGRGQPLFSMAAAAVPAVGDQLTLNTSTQGGCSQTAVRKDRVGRVVAVTQRAIIVADNGNPLGGFTDAEYSQFAADFDALAYPVVTENFGTPTVDIDNNGGRALIFYTRAVNELTAAGSEFYVGGYFYGADLFPRVGPNNNSTDDDCPASNEAEIFYMLVPDPLGEVNGNVRTKEFVRRVTVSTLGHEFQHLVNASLRIYTNDATSYEEVWLNEGMSHIAEELMFYRVSGLAPRQNLGISAIRATTTTVNAYNEFQASNVGRYIDYLESPETTSPYMTTVDIATRGAAWYLLRYAADQSSTAEQTLWRQLANSKVAGDDNFNAVFGPDLLPTIRTWAPANYADDAVSGLAASLQHLSWNMRSIIPYLLNNTNPPPYPLVTRTLAAGTPLTISLRGGAAAFLRFAVPANTTANIGVTLSGGGAVPASTAFTVVRTK